MKLELVGMGQQPLGRDGEVEGWRITYLPEGAEAPDFVHHVMPAAIFANYAEEFGLDVDDPADFDEVLDIVLHEVFGGDENPVDSIEPTRRAQDKKNATGRRMRRRADRAKQSVEITGVESVRERLREERHTGRAQRVERMQTAQRAREGRKPVTEAAPVPQPGRIA